jgi:hypothetical protein
LERSAFDVLDESDDEVYHARQPSTKSKVEREGPTASHDCERASAASFSRSEARMKSRGRSKLRLGLAEEEEEEEGWRHGDVAVGSDVC